MGVREVEPRDEFRVEGRVGMTTAKSAEPRGFGGCGGMAVPAMVEGDEDGGGAKETQARKGAGKQFENESQPRYNMVETK